MNVDRCEKERERENA
uniref:Uncharacterized protein n=1 Tax=Anguilla anguilla TaxID=7936 RepID=A0A0E9W4D7_ANGAN